MATRPPPKNFVTGSVFLKGEFLNPPYVYFKFLICEIASENVYRSALASAGIRAFYVLVNSKEVPSKHTHVACL